MERIFAFSLILLGTIATAVAFLNVELFQHSEFQGESKEYSLKKCTNFHEMGHRASSLRMEGSCLQYYATYNCSGPSGLLIYPNTSIELLQKWKWNDNLLSAQPCPCKYKELRCPAGTYVRKLDVSADNIRDGITIYCYMPTGKHPMKELNTVRREVLDVSSTVTCDAALTGLKFSEDRLARVVTDAVGLCDHTDSLDHGILSCDEGKALVGLIVKMENASNVIKRLEIICGRVHNPALDCIPTENFVQVQICDNQRGVSPASCQFEWSVGFRSVQSVEKAKQKDFYTRLALSQSFGIPWVVKVKFGDIGYSQKSRYDWRSSLANVWVNETRIQVATTAFPGTLSRFEQLVGKCGQFEVGANYIRRIDLVANASFTARPMQIGTNTE